MKPYLILIPIIALALLQGVFLPFNLVLLVVLIWSAIKPPIASLWIAFWGGIFLDLAKGTPLGGSSLFLLTTSYIIHIYSRRFDPSHLAFWPLFVFLTSATFNLIFGKPWLAESLILSLLSLLGRPLIRFYQESFGNKGLRLKL